MTSNRLLVLLSVLLVLGPWTSEALAQGIPSVPAPLPPSPVQSLHTALSAPSALQITPTSPLQPSALQNMPVSPRLPSAQKATPASADKNDESCVCSEAFREMTLGHYYKALRLFQQYTTTLEEYQGPNSVDVARVVKMVGECQFNLNHFAEADAAYMRAIKIFRDSGKNAEADSTLAQLSSCYRTAKKCDAAIVAANTAISSLHALPSEGKQVAHSRYSLASIESANGNEDNATARYRQRLRIRDQFGIEDHETGALVGNVANAYFRASDNSTAEILYWRQVSILKRTDKIDSDILNKAIAQLASVYRREGKKTEAYQLYQTFETEASTALGQDDPAVLNIVRQMGDCCMETEKFEESVECYQHLLRSTQNKQYYIYDLDNLSVALFKSHQYEKAEPICKQLIETLTRDKSPANAQKLSIVYRNYAKLLRVMNREQEAQKLEVNL